jgi:SAM-dependent methyltransferase
MLGDMSTSSSETFQVTLDAAEAYEASFVPAFFEQWAPLLCLASGVSPGDRVLDVACGTGIVARTVADRTDSTDVVGVDVNEAMLTVARRVRPDLDWRRGDATGLPLADASFDVVLCQMALMFFPDRVAALREMARVTAPGGTVAVLVPSGLDDQAAYGPFVEVAARHGGAEARSLLGSYFSCGERAELVTLFQRAGLNVVAAETRLGIARFPSVDALVTTEVESTPLGQRVTDQVLERIRADARSVLAPFTTGSGALEAPFSVRVVVGRRGSPA